MCVQKGTQTSRLKCEVTHRDYGKVDESGKLRLSPETLTIKHPPEDVLLLLGYLPVRYTEKPVPEQGYDYVDHYEVQGEEIVQIWTITPAPEPEPQPEPEDFEAEFQRRIQEVL